MNGQLAFACYQGPRFALAAVNVLTLRGDRVADITGFLDPASYAPLVLPEFLPSIPPIPPPDR